MSIKINTASSLVSKPTIITQASSCDIISIKNVEPNIFNSLICALFPTNKVYRKESFSHKGKNFIISQNPFQPKGPFSKTVII